MENKYNIKDKAIKNAKVVPDWSLYSEQIKLKFMKAIV